MIVGDVYKTNYWGDVEVVEILGGRNIVVRFVNTGNLRKTRSDYLLVGNVKDSEAASAGVKIIGNRTPAFAPIPVGPVFASNLYGNMEVVEFKNSKNIQIKFVDTGNLQQTQRNSLESGMVQDVLLKGELIAEREAKAIEDRNCRDVNLQQDRGRRAEVARQAACVRGEEKQMLREESLKRKEFANAERVGGVLGKTLTTSIGDTFKVLCATDSVGKSYLVEFEGTKVRYIVKSACITKGTVHDYDSTEYMERLRTYRARNSAKWYEDNRDDRIAKAGAYQRENVEAARERNRRDAVRRGSAEGSHTKGEKGAMLVEQDNKCACCGYDLSLGKHIDHIMPISLGGSNYIENLQWLCQACNSIKSNRHPDDWAIYSKGDEFASRLSARRKLN